MVWGTHIYLPAAALSVVQEGRRRRLSEARSLPGATLSATRGPLAVNGGRLEVTMVIGRELDRRSRLASVVRVSTSERMDKTNRDAYDD